MKKFPSNRFSEKEKERKKKKSGPATGFSKCNSESLPFITSRGLWMQSRAKLGLSQLYHMGCHCVTAGRTRDSAVKTGKLLTRKGPSIALFLPEDLLQPLTSEGAPVFWGGCLNFCGLFCFLCQPGSCALWLFGSFRSGFLRFALHSSWTKTLHTGLALTEVARKQKRCFAEIKQREPPLLAALPLKWRYGGGSSERAFSWTHPR